jgi:hypothetical protein
MADWNTVRFDPTYEEKLDPEIIPLCDALNATGFVTTASCCGHGGWPCIWFEHSTDECIESLARFVMQHEIKDCQRYFSVFKKTIQVDGYIWSIHIHLNNVYHDTPLAVAMKEAEFAIAGVTQTVKNWQRGLY